MDPNSAPEVVPYSNLEHYNQNNSAYNYQHDKNSPLTDSSQQPKKRKIAGLAPTTFWLLIILAIVIIVAAVGGGVGGSMAVAKAKKSNDDAQPAAVETTTLSGNSSATGTNPSETSSAPYRVPSGAQKLPLDCETSGEILAVEWSGSYKNFELTCNGIRHMGDGAGFRSYLLSDCVTACIKMNSLWGDKACTAAVFDTNLADIGGTNCFLKNVTIAKKDIVVQKGAVLAVFKP